YRIADLLEALSQVLNKESAAPRELQIVALLAIIGRPNVGKSTLFNRLAGRERVIVHETAGTTRDTIDVLVEREGKQFVFVDTAGIKRKRATRTRLEKFTVIRTLKAIETSQAVLFILDAGEPLTHQERTLLHMIAQGEKGLLLLVNKWDLMRTGRERYVSALRTRLGSLQNIPILCISAKTGLNCRQIWKKIAR
ncbi:MAG: GTP-binding protein, partial [Deltaproteobacteria bacterium]|nr:GTP-binding protein [Deltaproteobacteria bacterium]